MRMSVDVRSQGASHEHQTTARRATATLPHAVLTAAGAVSPTAIVCASADLQVEGFLLEIWLLRDGCSVGPGIARCKVHFAAAVTDNGRALTNKE
jgi:hypothetical protein